MAVDYTTTGLIALLKRKSMLPTNESTFSATGYLSLMNNKLLDSLVPTILKSKSEFFVTKYSFDMVANQETYALPDRAMSDKLRAIYKEDINGNIYNPEQIEIDQLPYYDTDADGNDDFGLYMMNNEIHLYPAPTSISSGDKLTIHYYRRPNSLIETTACSKITAINRSTGVIAVGSVPSTFANGSIMDFIENEPPFKTIDDDVTSTTVDSTAKTITFAVADIPASLEVNDYICLRGESPIPQIPWEYHSILAQMGAVDALIALRDFSKAKVLKEELNEMLEKMTSTITNRIEDKPHKIKNHNSFLFRRRW